MSETATQTTPEVAERQQRSVQTFAGRLGRAVEQSEKQIVGFREARTQMVKEFVGRWYGSASDKGLQQPLNILYNVVTTLLPTLVISVRSRITTKRVELRDFARVFQEAVNGALMEMKMDATFRRGVMAAFFGPTAFKCGLAPANDFGQKGESGNILADPGKAFTDVVDLDDLVVDMTARSPGEMAFVGNRYWVPFDWAMASGMYDTELLERLQVNEQTRRNQGENMRWNAARIPDDAFLIDRVQLLDVWVPSMKAVVTIPGDAAETTGFLAEVGWEGPELGPYILPTVSDAPGLLMPVSVLGVIYDLYVAMNTTMRKVIQRAANRKDVGIFTQGQEKSSQAIRTSNDGDMLGVPDKNQFATLTFGGSPEEGTRLIDWLRKTQNEMAGNPDLVAGLGPQASTLGQDQMNLASARVRLADWERGIRAAATEIVKQVAWYEWTDVDTRRDLEIRVPGLGTLAQEWDPTVRKGEFPNYLIDINPFGQFAGGPAEQAAKKREFITTVVIPLGSFAQAGGLTLDVKRITDDLAGDMGIEDGAGFFTEAVQQAPAGQMPGNPLAVSNDTTINAGGRRMQAPEMAPAPSPEQAPEMAPQPAGV